MKIEDIPDPIERIVAQVLRENHIKWLHEMEHKNQKFDFFLPDFGVYLEVKQFSTPRTSEQIKDREDVIVIQGRMAAEAFADMLRFIAS